MSILNKTLAHESLGILDLFLNGALRPLEGYISCEDHISILTNSRLNNGYLWPFPLVLELDAAEKLQAQLTKRIALLDDEKRVVAEVSVNGLYRLPAEIAQQTGKNPASWYASGPIRAAGKILHPAFNSIRHQAAVLGQTLRDSGWKSIIAVHSDGRLDATTMQQACTWLKAEPGYSGGILLQVDADDNSPTLHSQMREIRAQIRCNAAKQVKLNLLPKTNGLDARRCLLLKAIIARNFGATGFLINAAAPVEAQRWLLQHRDEIGLQLIPVRRSRSIQYKQEKQPDLLAAA